MNTKQLLFFALFSIMFTRSAAEQLWVGETYQCFMEDYANRSLSWLNISWSVDYGLYQNYSGSYVRTVSFEEYKSGTYTVKVNWTETDMSDSFAPFYHKSHTWSFTCKDNPLVLSPTSASISVGETKKLSCEFTYKNSYTKGISYSSSNTSVATVSSSGLVTAIGVGTAKITAKSASSKDEETCTVTVSSSDIKVTSISLNKTSLSLQTGQSETLTATVKPDNATDKSVTWSSSNTSVADVSTIGKVTAKSAGSTTITCKANDGSGVKDTCAVTVTATPAPKLVLSASPGGGQVSVGTKVTLTAKANGSTVSGCDIYYTTNGTTPTKSNGTKYASTGIIINNACTLKAIAYKDNYETSDMLMETYTVDNPADIRFVSVTCDNTDLDNLTQKDKLRMRATFENRGGTDEIYTMLALIDTSNGRILHLGDYDVRVFKGGEKTTVEHAFALDTIPVGKYEATILYYNWVRERWIYGGDEFVYNITVNSSVIKVTSITLNKTSLSLQTGQSETLTATVKPDNATDKTVTWSSDKTSVATVDNNGKVTAKAKGSATIICTAHDGSGVKETCAVTVTEPDPAPKVDILSVTCEKTTLKQSESLVMHATLKNRDETRTISTRLMLCDDEMNILYYGPSDKREYKTDEKVSVDFSFPLDTIPVGKYKATVMHLSKWLDDGKWYWTYNENKAIEVSIISNPNPKLELSASPGSGQVLAGTTVTLTAKVENKIVTGCDIYYTTNGYEPTKNSTKYSTGITISSNCTIKAIAYKDGYEASGVLTETYTVKNEDDFTDISKYANIVYMEPVTASAGNAITVPVRMKNAQANIMGFQFDLVLPAGITLAKDEDSFYKVDLSDDRTSSKKHTVSSQQQADGSVRVVCYSNNNSTFSGTDGNVLELTLNVASSVKEGDYALKLRDMVMTTPNLDSYSVPWVVSKLTILNFIVGDVNGNGKVDVVDVAGAVNLILNSGDTSKLNRKAADINGDNVINVVDVAGIVNIILNGNTGAKSRMMSPTRGDVQPLLYFNALPIEQGETIALPIMLNAADGSFTGCQFDLYLPEGLSVAEEDGFPLVEVGSGTTARKHTVSTSEQADGSLRVVCYSNNNYTFTGSEILTIAIHADTDAPEGNASVSMRNITLSRPDVTGIDLADYDNELIISSGIEGVIVDQRSETKVFSLSGQRLTAPRKGVNIVGGKKVVIK